MHEYIDHVQRLCRIAVVPHVDNAYRPHLLHPRRTVRYVAAFTVMKMIVLVAVVLLPAGIFAAPEAIHAQEEEIFRIVNGARAASGIAVLHADDRLTASAFAKSADMFARQYFAHVNEDGEGPGTFVSRTAYPYSVIGENLAMGFVTASDVVEAWRQSPAHAHNMLDAMFEDSGVRVLAGTYRGEPTVFIAQHFGRQLRSATAGALSGALASRASTGVDSAASPSATGATPIAQDVGVQEAAQGEQEPTPRVRAATLTWDELSSGETLVAATAVVDGSVASVRVHIADSEMTLGRTDETSNVFQGTATLVSPPEEVFRVVVPGSLAITDAGGTETLQTIPWEAPAIVRPSFGEKYTQAKRLLPETFGPTYRFARFIFAIAFIIFALAWLVNLLVEIRRQHLDLLVPGGALVLLLAVYWWV